MSKLTLGLTEELTLMAVREMPGRHGAYVQRELSRWIGRVVTIGASYSALDRLARKGLLRKVRLSENGPMRGRTPAVGYDLTSLGEHALERAKRAREAVLSQGRSE